MARAVEWLGSLLSATLALTSSVALAADCTATSADWCTYGKTAQRTFHGVTTLTPYSVQTLAPAWYFPTGDSVTANPVVAKGSVYVGSWDGFFYAIDAATGVLRWSYKLKAQPAVRPAAGSNPGQGGRVPRYLADLMNDPQALGNDVPGDVTSDGGMVTASAFFLPGNGNTDGKDLVIFGAGYTLYALRADDGSEFFTPRDFPGTGCAPVTVAGVVVCSPAGDPTTDEARIFSSPAVVGNRILFSVDADGQNHHRGYLVSASLEKGEPQWIRELDVDKDDNILNDGCGNVWASPTILPNLGVEVVSVSDCHFSNPVLHEKILGVDIASGDISWVVAPGRDDPQCDWDFGATANAGLDAGGDVTFLGVGGKDGTYYSIDPTTLAGPTPMPSLKWKRNVVFGGFAGGFIGSTAYDGTRVYGATALGDFGRFEGAGTLGCMPGKSNEFGNPDLPIQEPSVHALDAGNGSLVWNGLLSQSFGPTVVAGGMVFVGTGITAQVHIHDAASGIPLKVIQLPASSDSGIIVAGDTLYFGIGTSERGTPSGVMAFRPLGADHLGPLPPLPPLPPILLTPFMPIFGP